MVNFYFLAFLLSRTGGILLRSIFTLSSELYDPWAQVSGHLGHALLTDRVSSQVQKILTPCLILSLGLLSGICPGGGANSNIYYSQFQLKTRLY